MGKFNLVDFAAHYQKGFRNHIVAVDEVPALIESFKHYGCYATYFFYSDEVLTYMSAQAEDSTATIAGYDGKVWAPFLPIDLDHPELGEAQEAARYLGGFLLERWQVDPNAMQICFSGAKGFHLMLDTRIFGKILPSKNLPLIFDSLRRHLAMEIPEPWRGTVDFGIKDRVRLLRLPNTIHEKSKLYKVSLGLDELQHWSPAEIRAAAKNPQGLTCTDETGLLSRVGVQENAAAAQLFQQVRRQLRKLTRKPFAYRFRRPENLSDLTFPCAGLEAIWESHIEPGSRNNCAIRLASELRLLGLSEDEAQNKLFEWNEKNRIELPSDELLNVIRSAYQHRFPYRYSCRDSVRRSFCPLPNYQACRKFVAERWESRLAAESS
ncbi:MAG: primase C-terminal domain-containing protein [Candidatus Binatia bacterium]